MTARGSAPPIGIAGATAREQGNRARFSGNLRQGGDFMRRILTQPKLRIALALFAAPLLCLGARQAAAESRVSIGAGFRIGDHGWFGPSVEWRGGRYAPYHYYPCYTGHPPYGSSFHWSYSRHSRDHRNHWNVRYSAVYPAAGWRGEYDSPYYAPHWRTGVTLGVGYSRRLNRHSAIGVGLALPLEAVVIPAGRRRWSDSDQIARGAPREENTVQTRSWKRSRGRKRRRGAAASRRRRRGARSCLTPIPDITAAPTRWKRPPIPPAPRILACAE